MRPIFHSYRLEALYARLERALARANYYKEQRVKKKWMAWMFSQAGCAY